MATIIKKIVFSFLLIITSGISLAHTIYAPSDIPLLDNRFRIDPLTEQVTIILNHSQGPQGVVLVRPDGSKLYYHKHPKSVAWVTSKTEDIITIDKPMVGPWQAVADLNGKNRIKLISHVELKTSKLPLKLYNQEYITTHASLYYDNKLMTENAYLSDAKLSIVLIGGADKQLTLYQDDGKDYDALPFDGTLTARVFIDLFPGRYLLSIRTKNNVFIRNENKDAVVFASPIKYEISALEYGSEEALFIFTADSEELAPDSITIDGVIKDANNTIIGKVIAHSAGNISAQDIFTKTEKLTYGAFTFSAKAFATTRSGREIELQLPEQQFELRAKVVMPTIDISEALTTDAEITEQDVSTSLWENSWIIIAIAASALILIAASIFIVMRHRRKNKQPENSDELPLTELSFDELQPTPIDLNNKEKQTEKQAAKE